MKALFSYLLTVALIYGAAERATAQTCSCPTGQVASFKIFYTYDAAGNRIKRLGVCTCVLPMAQPGSESRLLASATEDSQVITAASVAAPAIVSISPNPTNGALYVRFNGVLTEGSLLLSDATGASIAVYPVSGDSHTIDMAALPSGMYYCNLRTATIQQTLKVVKTD